MKFSEKLYFLRKRMALSQEQLAEQLDVSRQAISKWEGGMAFPESEKLIVISEFFGISLDDLLKDDRDIDECFADKKQEIFYPRDRAKFFLALAVTVFSFIFLLTIVIWMICCPASSQELAASSVITLNGRAILLLASTPVLFFGILLLLKNKPRGKK